ncbi:MAG: ribosomal protein methyltransferase [Chitinophagaceae bacterium]|jgi:ribosomal protein L11 methyltransferase|nr:ribosomal protein methyltransferase [Chitinophagaceae bacterium]
MNYIEVTIHVRDTQLREILIAQLSAENYYGFEEGEEFFKAYIRENEFKEDVLKGILGNLEIVYKINTIADQNWNELWESNFQPITVEDFVGVRASFHQPTENVQHEIIITPKMSFGTGHHATTWLMMQDMRSVEFTGKRVFDFGTGTGILAILAEKLGASEVLAVDHDDWCVQNATENIETNDCARIILMKGDTANVLQQFDIIIANINRNIIEDNLQYLAQNLVNGGQLLLSGLLAEDEAPLKQLLTAYKLAHLNTLHRSGWIAMRCGKIPG